MRHSELPPRPLDTLDPGRRLDVKLFAVSADCEAAALGASSSRILTFTTLAFDRKGKAPSDESKLDDPATGTLRLRGEADLRPL